MNIALQNFFWWLICTFTLTPKEDFKKFLILSKLIISAPSKPSRSSGPWMSIVVGINNIFLVLFPRFRMNHCWYRNKQYLIWKPQYSAYMSMKGMALSWGCHTHFPQKESFLKKSISGVCQQSGKPKFDI